MNPQQCGHIKSCAKSVKNVISVDVNDALREVNYRRAVRFLEAALNIIYIFHQ